MARLTLPLILAGLPGILILPLLMPAPEGVPAWALVINPLILLFGAAFAGGWAAPRCGLALRRPGAALRDRAAQVLAGLVLGLGIAAADHAGRGWWQAAPGLPPSLTEGWSVGAFALGLLYGGVTEEVLLRWGLMSLLLLAAWSLLARRAPAPPRGVVLVAILLSALAFAAAHLPAIAATGAAMSGPLVARTLLLNSLAGALFGWLFARRDLIAAMAAHGSAHVGFAIAANLG